MLVLLLCSPKATDFYKISRGLNCRKQFVVLHQNELKSCSYNADRGMEKYLALGLINKPRDLNAYSTTELQINLAHLIQMKYAYFM